MNKQNLIHRAKDRTERILNRRIGVSNRLPFIELQKRFLSVWMDITSRCNLSCMICWRSDKNSRTAPKSDIEERLFLKIAREIFPRTAELFLSCGAEPLIARNLLSMLEVIGRGKIPFVAFTTNALLFNEDIARRVVEIGVNEIYVSFDGATEETFAKIRGGASVSKVIEKIRLLNRVKRDCSTAVPKIELHMTLMRSNIREIEQIIEIAHDLELPRVTALHLWPHLGLDEENLYNHKRLYNECIAGARKRARELGVELDAPPQFGTKESYSPDIQKREVGAGQSCRLPWNSTVIRPDGQVAPCSFMYNETAFGNLNEKSFRDIWYGPNYQALREEIRCNNLRDFCARCPAHFVKAKQLGD